MLILIVLSLLLIKNVFSVDHESLKRFHKIEDILNKQQATIVQLQSTIKNHENTIQNHENTIQNHENTIQNHENTIQNHENTIQNHANTIQNHENTIQSHENTIQSHENTIQSHENTIQSHEKTIQSHENTIQSHENTIQKQKSIIKYFQRINKYQDHDISNIQNKDKELANVSNSAERNRRQSVSNVAFSATIPDYQRGYPGQHFKYTKEAYDNTASFNPSDGIFAVPVSGTYVFTWYVVGAYQSTQLLVDGQAKSYLLTDIADHGQRCTGAQTVILRVNKGQHVWIQSGIEGHFVLSSENYNSFSGWLLFQ